MNEPEPPQWCERQITRRSECPADQFRWLISALFVHLVAAGWTAPVSILSQPQNDAVALYQQAAFGLIAQGTGPISYQWKKMGIPIPGATNDHFVIMHVRFADSGNYSIIVCNSENCVDSADAVLSVRLPNV